ncbi:hypothetical protein PTKIN_Ptkin10aG0028600 [Pterospermum kingtungense]
MVEPNKDIPQDITDQILLCLPVKSVTRFKCVCKSWKSLITRPSFTRNHFKRARSQNPKIINDQKLLIPLCGGFRSLDLEKYSFDERPTILIPKNGYYRIQGSCHGLICLLGEIDLRGVYSNGALHWNFDLDSLCTFDLRMERFHYGPRLDASMIGLRWKLFGTGETVNCWGIKKGIYSFDFELWLMEKYCLEGTWTKVLCIPCSSDLPN